MYRKQLGLGSLFFAVHFLIEVATFYVIAGYTDDPVYWTLALAYDFFAFVPQGIYGYLRDHFFPKFDFALLGAGLTAVSLLLFRLSAPWVLVIGFLSLGNGMIHIHAAEETLRRSPGRMTPSALFVSGGSFGLITGRLLGNAGVSVLWIFAAVAILIAVDLAAKRIRLPADPENLRLYRFANTAMPVAAVAALAVAVVIIRAYMGYGIPTSWNKTVAQTAALYCFMGVGKALGGILTDRIGIRATALLSTVGALPFLLCGDRYMFVSLFGVMLFSMTMAITLGVLVSALPSEPGAAFGLTTVGLALGSFPVFVYRLPSFTANCVMVGLLTAVSFPILWKTCAKKEDPVHV